MYLSKRPSVIFPQVSPRKNLGKAPLQMRISYTCVSVRGALTQFQSRDIGPAVKMWPTLSSRYLIFVILSILTTGNATSSFVRNGKYRFSWNTLYVVLIQGVPTSFRWEVLVKISNLREIRILKFFRSKKFVKLKWDLQCLARM